MTQSDQDMAVVESAVAALREHFDTVQILVTRYEPDNGTVSVCKGSGNWFARSGQMREWLLKNEEESRIEVQADDIDEEGED